jgi:hypothetical protein
LRTIEDSHKNGKFKLHFGINKPNSVSTLVSVPKCAQSLSEIEFIWMGNKLENHSSKGQKTDVRQDVLIISVRIHFVDSQKLHKILR